MTHSHTAGHRRLDATRPLARQAAGLGLAANRRAP